MTSPAKGLKLMVPTNGSNPAISPLTPKMPRPSHWTVQKPMTDVQIGKPNWIFRPPPKIVVREGVQAIERGSFKRVAFSLWKPMAKRIAAAGVAAVADGPLPIGDIVGLALLVWGVGEVAHGIFKAVKSKDFYDFPGQETDLQILPEHNNDDVIVLPSQASDRIRLPASETDTDSIMEPQREMEEMEAMEHMNFHFDNDAHVDDLVAFILLWSAFGANLQSVTINDGNSRMMPAELTFRKLFDVLEARHIQLGLGQKEIPNPFPPEWRDISFEINRLPSLSHVQPATTEATSTSLETLKKTAALGPFHMVVVGPLTNVAEWISQDPNAIGSIQGMTIMGGALNVSGNVKKSDKSDGTAEWNFFADPLAIETVLKSNVPITLVPLDATNHLPVSEEVIRILSKGTNPESIITHELWRLVYQRYNYWLWDVVAALIAIDPNIATLEERTLSVITTGSSQGRVVECKTGKRCSIAAAVDPEKALKKMEELLIKK